MTKIALTYVHEALQKGGYDAHTINTIHDEIVVEAREDQAEEVCALVEREMVRAGEVMITRIPVAADAHIDSCWSKG